MKSHSSLGDLRALAHIMPSAVAGVCECGHGLDACKHSGCRAPMVLGLGLNRKALDNKHVAEYYWLGGLKPQTAQKPCDHGLFSDDAKQIDIIDYLQPKL